MKKTVQILCLVMALAVALPGMASAEEMVIDLQHPTVLPGVVWQEDTVLITGKGVYRLTGSSDQYAVQVDSLGSVELILENVSITAADRPAILIENAAAATITLVEGSVNILTASGDCKGAVHAKADLTVSGIGDLTITNPVTKGIYGKKSITIAGGNLTVSSLEDAIHSKKDVTITGGQITLDTWGDGISADDDLRILDGVLNITTHGQPVPIQADTAENSDMESAEDEQNGIVYPTAEGEQLLDFDEGIYTGVSISEGTILISHGGEYRLKGTANAYSFRVETTEDVNLILDGVSLSIADTPLLYVETAGSITLTLAEGSVNDVSATGDVKAVLFAKTDLMIDGAGTLNVTSDTAKGIKSKYTLTIQNGSINVNTENDAVSVDGDLELNGGIIDLTTRGVALAVAGEMHQNGSVITIDQPENAVPATEETEEEPASSETDSSDNPYVYVKTWTVYEDGEVVDIGNSSAGLSLEMDFETACKGLKAEDKIEISGGTFLLNTADHAIRAVGDLTITGGTFTIASTYGKGIASHENLVIDGANTSILITQCTEGMEGKGSLTIQNGHIVIHANDDALNAGDSEAEKNGVVLVINGGEIEADSMDDCLDANGILELNGGLVKASKSKGTVVGFNAVISGDAVHIQPGASMMIALGNPGEIAVDCPQNALLIYFTQNHAAGETLVLTDEIGQEWMRYVLPMSCSAVYLTSPAFSENAAFTLQAGEERIEAEIGGLFTILGMPLEDAQTDYNYGNNEDEGDASFQWQSHYNGK